MRFIVQLFLTAVVWVLMVIVTLSTGLDLVKGFILGFVTLLFAWGILRLVKGWF